MRRLALFFFLAVLSGLMAVGISPALAANTDWTVNGIPLAAGQEVSVKFASISPIQLVAPAQGIDITCASWKANGTLVGGEVGTGELVNSKLAHCTQLEEGAPGPIKAKVHFTSVTLHTGTNPPVGSAGTTTFQVIGDDCTFKKPHCEPTAAVTGLAESFGPTPGGAGNVVDFPQPALPASTLTIGGSPAELVGKAVFKLPKHATLSQTAP